MGNGESFFSLKRLKDKLYGNKEVRILMCGEFTTIGDCVQFEQLAVWVGLSFTVHQSYVLSAVSLQGWTQQGRQLLSTN